MKAGFFLVNGAALALLQGFNLLQPAWAQELGASSVRIAPVQAAPASNSEPIVVKFTGRKISGPSSVPTDKPTGGPATSQSSAALSAPPVNVSAIRQTSAISQAAPAPAVLPPVVDAKPAPNFVPAPAVVGSATDMNRPIRDKWALIVGITQFQSAKIPRLKYSTKDAADFANYLTKEAHFAPDHVRILLNEKATQRRISSELGNKFLARVAKKDDLVVLFFSTHGSPSQMDIRNENFLVAWDSDPDDLYSSGVDMQKILGSISSRVLCDRVLLVLDACHSGAINPNAKGMTRSANFDAQELATGSGQMVICSSSPDEQSWESKRYPNGVFTHNLLEGLRKTGANTPLSYAFDVARDRVADEVREDHPGARQTPVLNSKWSGNSIVIAGVPSQPQELPDSVIADLEPDSTGVTLISANTRKSSGPAKESSNGAKPVMLSKPSSSEESFDPDAAPVDVLKLTSTYFSNEQDPRKALAAAFQLKSQFFNDPQYGYKAAAIRIQMGQYGSANTDLKGLLVDEPNNWQFLLAKGYCLHKLKEDGQARDYVRQAQFHNPTLPKTIQWGD